MTVYLKIIMRYNLYQRFLLCFFLSKFPLGGSLQPWTPTLDSNLWVLQGPIVGWSGIWSLPQKKKFRDDIADPFSSVSLNQCRAYIGFKIEIDSITKTSKQHQFENQPDLANHWHHSILRWNFHDLINKFTNTVLVIQSRTRVSKQPQVPDITILGILFYDSPINS